jgi:hypothetical protein
MSATNHPRRGLTGRDEWAQIQAALASLFVRVGIVEENLRRLAAALNKDDVLVGPEPTGGEIKDELLERAQTRIEEEVQRTAYAEAIARRAEELQVAAAKPKDFAPPPFDAHPEITEAKKKMRERFPLPGR